MKNMPIKRPVISYNSKKAKKGKKSGTTIYKRPKNSQSVVQSPAKSSLQVFDDSTGQATESLVKIEIKRMDSQRLLANV